RGDEKIEVGADEHDLADVEVAGNQRQEAERDLHPLDGDRVTGRHVGWVGYRHVVQDEGHATDERQRRVAATLQVAPGLRLDMATQLRGDLVGREQERYRRHEYENDSSRGDDDMRGFHRLMLYPSFPPATKCFRPRHRRRLPSLGKRHVSAYCRTGLGSRGSDRGNEAWIDRCGSRRRRASNTPT